MSCWLQGMCNFRLIIHFMRGFVSSNYYAMTTDVWWLIRIASILLFYFAMRTNLLIKMNYTSLKIIFKWQRGTTIKTFQRIFFYCWNLISLIGNYIFSTFLIFNQLKSLEIIELIPTSLLGSFDGNDIHWKRRTHKVNCSASHGIVFNEKVTLKFIKIKA